MKILAVANFVPLRDQSAGWFRFYHLLRLLAGAHEVYLHPYDSELQLDQYGPEATNRYRGDLQSIGIQITTGAWADMNKLLRGGPMDIVLFEHYSAAGAGHVVDQVRFWQPQARIVIDSIDVAFNRLASKAAVTGKHQDVRRAEEVKAKELALYSRADAVIAISDADRALLRRENPRLRVEVIPLIYPIAPLGSRQRLPARNLLYVAHFDHDANVDGIVDFCANVLPLIVDRVPDARLRIVGRSPPEVVRALGGPHVEVLGYVPEIGKIYRASDVAVAPMRYGGGLKGKIVEAMSYGLPVVTNTICLQGFDLVPGRDVLIGDDPPAFAHAVVALMEDVPLYESIRDAGWSHVKAHFSEDVVARSIREVIGKCHETPAKTLSTHTRALWMLRQLMERHVLWRFGAGVQGKR